MSDTSDKPKGRVIAGSGANIFKSVSGGRSDYGGLIISALTGKTHEELVEGMARNLTKADLAAYQKAIAETGDVNATLLDAEDQFFLDYLRITAGPSLIAPPIAPERLERLVAENNALEPCIAAMVTNISGTGYEIMLREGSEAEVTEQQETQRATIKEFLAECSPRKSYMRLRKELRRDLHATGNSYAVVERTLTGEIAFIRRAPAKSMRMIVLDEAVPVSVKVRRGGVERELRTVRAERRFVQKVGTKLVYYKEYGASRDLHRVTGQWAPLNTLPPDQRAHEVIHDKDLEDVKSPYGMPRWITQLPSVLGSRMAEEHNLAFFQSGGVPPVIVFIAGGLVSEEVARTLNAYLSGGSREKQRGVAVEVPSSGDVTNEKPANVQVERFGSDTADSTFENYDKRCEERIRRAFRLPGIFLGMAESYNFATAHASYVVAEAQVFAPERDEEDERFNMTIMREIDPTGEWRVVSNPLSVQDVNLQLRALDMLSKTKGVGLADLVGEISKIAGLEIEINEEYAEEVVSGGPDLATLLAGGGGGQEPPQNGQNGPQRGNPPTDGEDGAPAGQDPQAPAPGVSSQVRNRIVAIAARIARAVRSYDDLADDRDLDALLEVEKDYDALGPELQPLVNAALAPILYNSPFLNEAVMADLAGGYAKAAFAEARRARKMEAAE